MKSNIIYLDYHQHLILVLLRTKLSPYGSVSAISVVVWCCAGNHYLL